MHDKRKITLTYDRMTAILDEMIPELRQRGYDEVVAVVRGGMTAAQYIAKQLRLPVGVYYPSNDVYHTPRLMTCKRKVDRLLFVEDLIAKGRTKDELDHFMRGFEGVAYDFLPLVVDAHYVGHVDLYGMRTERWVVFPYEKPAEVVVGDRGLFRDGSDQYMGEGK